ncbi:MAG: sulfotransferase [Halioglobus sp.]|nr:sulfotransferase [Halioglobus sp.]
MAVSSRPLQLEYVTKAAQQRTGLNDYGDDSFHAPLKVLLKALVGQANLNESGTQGQSARIIEILCQRLLMQSFFNKYPEIASEEILNPVVIVGLPRTGTTMLHRTLGSDERFYTPLWFETRFPSPPIDWDFIGKDPRLDAAKSEIRTMLDANPELAAMHPFDAEAADEEIMLLEQSFYSSVPEAFCNIPDYANWVDAHDNTPGYQYLYRVLQFLQWQKKRKGQGVRRWLLKAPHHMHHLDLLLETFPGVKVIQTHRDPLETIPSLTSLNYGLWSLNTDNPDPKAVADIWCAKFSHSMRLAIGIRDQHSDCFFDVNYDDTTRNADGVLDSLYQFIGMEFTDMARAAIQDWRNNNRRDDRAVHEYSPEQFGYTEQFLKAEFKEYRHRYGFE